MFTDLIRILEPISKVFNALLHPIQTLTVALDYILTYIPSVCVVIFLFYIITGSKKILNALSFAILFFILLKVAMVFNYIWLIAVVLAAVVIIRLVGVIL